MKRETVLFEVDPVKIRALMDEDGITTRKLAEEAGCTANYVARVLAGTATPSKAMAHAFAAALSTNIDAIKKEEEPAAEQMNLPLEPAPADDLRDTLDAIRRNLAGLTLVMAQVEKALTALKGAIE